jgi:hypothetical protein
MPLEQISGLFMNSVGKIVDTGGVHEDISVR